MDGLICELYVAVIIISLDFRISFQTVCVGSSFGCMTVSRTDNDPLVANSRHIRMPFEKIYSLSYSSFHKRRCQEMTIAFTMSRKYDLCDIRMTCQLSHWYPHMWVLRQSLKKPRGKSKHKVNQNVYPRVNFLPSSNISVKSLKILQNGSCTFHLI